MKRGHATTGWIALALFLSGCNDFSQHRFGGVRSNIPEAPPRPAAALAITNSPGADPQKDAGVKAATFVPRPALPDPAEAQLLQHPMRLLYQRAVQQYTTMDSYFYRFKRREVVAGAKQPEELILIKVRREPYSVYLKWLGNEGKGRETVYVHGKNDNKMRILLAASDAFPLPAGLKMSVSPDDPMVKAKSRYPITETGLGSLIERYGRMVAGIERGDEREGTAKYLGRVKRDEFGEKVECVYQVLPAKYDANLPKGGERWWFFDATHALPVLIITHDASGEVEYYCHDHIQAVRLDDADFDTERLWRK